MPKKPRFAPPGYNIHVTQRGNYRQQTFFTAYDHRFFLNLIARHAPRRSVDVLAYCLMPNHFHLIIHGHQLDSISRFMQSVNGQYAQNIHSRLELQGRFWQDRFFSCVLDNAHLVAALRYVELNPVRAKLASCPIEYPWSSASIHIGKVIPPPWLQMSTFDQLFTPAEWRQNLIDGQSAIEHLMISRATSPAVGVAGSKEFVKGLEASFGTKLEVRGPGRQLAKQAAATLEFIPILAEIRSFSNIPANLI